MSVPVLGNKRITNKRLARWMLSSGIFHTGEGSTPEKTTEEASMSTPSGLRGSLGQGRVERVAVYGARVGVGRVGWSRAESSGG